MGTIASALRLVRAGWIMAREGVFLAIPDADLPGGAAFGLKLARALARRSARQRDGTQSLSKAANRLGPSYVKLGQFLATRPDVVGREIAEDLSNLQDRIPPFPVADARRTVTRALGRPADEVFATFSEPVAAASIAQVHRARVAGADGDVAIKVIRPGVRERFHRDNQAFLLASRLQERFIPSTRRLKPVDVSHTLERTTRMEMDLRLEAAALSEMAENTRNDAGFRVPAVNWDLTARDVLTMEWIDGVRMSDIDGLKRAGHDLKALAAGVVQHFLRHALRDGFFHADMHPGNLFVDASGAIVAVDLGISGRLDSLSRRVLAEILYGFITRNYRRVAEVHFEAGYVPAHHSVEDFAQAIRAIGEPIHGQSAASISMARLLTLLFEVTELFDMTTRTELILLQKTMVVVEGVARSLDPDFDMWKTAEPVVAGWIADNLGPKAALADAHAGLSAAIRIAREAPAFAERLERLSRQAEIMAANGLRFDAETAEAIGRAEARHGRSGRIALWIIAAAAVYLAATLG